MKAYRRTGTPPGGLTVREIKQWEALLRDFPADGLRFSRYGIAMLRHAPAPPFGLAEASGEIPLNKEKLRFYQAIQAGTEHGGICTRCDLAHLLWSEGYNYPESKILDVLLSKTNAQLKRASFPKRIEAIFGRGYRLIDQAQAPK